MINAIIVRGACSLRGVLLFVCLSTAGACATARTAAYDPQVDAAVTQLHRETAAFFLTLTRQLGTPAAEHARHRDFYDRMRLGVASVRLRAAAHPANARTVEQIDLLGQSLDALEELHRSGLHDPDVLDTVRRQFDTAFTAILRLELAKRREPRTD